METFLIVVLSIAVLALSIALAFQRRKYSASVPLDAEKDRSDMILREIHHRVKNNFQTVSSLLNLNTRYLEDESAKELLWEGQNRIKSMALIHQQLYQRENTQAIAMPEYIDTLLNELEFSYNAASKDIRLLSDVAQVELSPEMAIPLGLIVHELVLNAFKYAFPVGKSGAIQTTISLGSEKLYLTVRDNGVGLPEGMEDPLKVKTSYGMRLVILFTQELKGQVHYESGDGTTAYFECPLKQNQR